MGHKVNPKVFRIGQSVNWASRWFSVRNYAELLKEDILVRRFLKNKWKEAGVDKIDIERTPAELTLIVAAARPGIIIGRGGAGIEDVKKEILAKYFKNSVKNLKINIQEVVSPNLSAAVMVNSMSADIEKRMPFRRVMKQAIDRVTKAGALGVKVVVSGRLNGAEIARTEMLAHGKVPLHTLRADIDYSRGAAFTTYGTIGIKVWIYKGEVFEEKIKQETVKQ